jgi:hypothetical protein
MTATDSPNISAAAERMRRHRDRRRKRLRCVTIELRESEIVALVRRGLLHPAAALVDWYVKLARVAKRYAKLDQERPDFAEVRADLSRLSAEQLLALKQLALIASGGATGDSSSRNTAAGVRRTIQGTTRSDRTRKDPSELR